AGNGVIAASNAGYLYASNLAYGANISAGAGSFRSFGDACYGAGYAGSQFCGAGEGYIGIEFDVSGDTHYGWVRIDVLDSANFSVMDFADESTAGEAISAGDVGEPASVADNAIAGFSQFYSTQTKDLTISANDAFSNITLFNIVGQQVISKKLSSNNETINLSSLKDGVYLANVTANGNTATFKIVKK